MYGGVGIHTAFSVTRFGLIFILFFGRGWGVGWWLSLKGTYVHILKFNKINVFFLRY